MDWQTSNRCAPLMILLQAYEHGDGEVIDRLAAQLKVTDQVLAERYMEAVIYANDFSGRPCRAGPEPAWEP